MSFEKIGEEIDRLGLIDLGFKFGPRDVHRKLYEAARRSLDRDRPISLTAAEKLDGKVKPKDTVLIATGTYFPPWYWYGETDGPPGAAVLARAVKLHFDATPVILTEGPLTDMMAATCRGAGLNVIDFEQAKIARSPSVAIMSFPSDDKDAQREARRIVSELNPAAFISIERMGRNEKGVYHTATGLDISPPVAKIDYVLEQCNYHHALTIGIGDVGNELGLGKIKDAIREHMLAGKICNCPCKGGAAVHVPADIPVIASVSNWATYGIVDCLAAIKDKPELLHTGEQEIRALRRCADAGAVDGRTAFCEYTADGTSEIVDAGVVEMMRTIVIKGLESIKGKTKGF